MIDLKQAMQDILRKQLKRTRFVTGIDKRRDERLDRWRKLASEESK